MLRSWVFLLDEIAYIDNDLTFKTWDKVKSHTFFIGIVIIFDFTQNESNLFINSFQVMIELDYLYNFVVHHI